MVGRSSCRRGRHGRRRSPTPYPNRRRSYHEEAPQQEEPSILGTLRRLMNLCLDKFAQARLEGRERRLDMGLPPPPQRCAEVQGDDRDGSQHRGRSPEPRAHSPAAAPNGAAQESADLPRPRSARFTCLDCKIYDDEDDEPTRKHSRTEKPSIYHSSSSSHRTYHNGSPQQRPTTRGENESYYHPKNQGRLDNIIQEEDRQQRGRQQQQRDSIDTNIELSFALLERQDRICDKLGKLETLMNPLSRHVERGGGGNDEHEGNNGDSNGKSHANVNGKASSLFPTSPLFERGDDLQNDLRKIAIATATEAPVADQHGGGGAGVTPSPRGVGEGRIKWSDWEESLASTDGTRETMTTKKEHGSERNGKGKDRETSPSGPEQKKTDKGM